MEYRTCPQCGSHYFLAKKTGPKIVFQVEADGRVVSVGATMLQDADIDTNRICCGACSWQGSLSELSIPL